MPTAFGGPGQALAVLAAPGSWRAEGKLDSGGFQRGHLAQDLRSGDKGEIQKEEAHWSVVRWGEAGRRRIKT